MAVADTPLCTGAVLPTRVVPEVSHCTRLGTYYYPEVPGALRVPTGKGIVWDQSVIDSAAWPEVYTINPDATKRIFIQRVRVPSDPLADQSGPRGPTRQRLYGVGASVKKRIRKVQVLITDGR